VLHANHAVPRIRRRIPRVEHLERRELLATLTVTSLGDSGAGTIRAAIQQANLDQTPDVVTFATGLTGTIKLESALPALATSMSLTGPGSSMITLARDSAAGTPAFQILSVDKAATVSVSGLTITGGGGSSEVNSAQPVVSAGGGILNAGFLTVSGCKITKNAIVGATLFNSGFVGGGGIANVGTLTLISSTVSDNATQVVQVDAVKYPLGLGGGIYNSGAASIFASTISGNYSIEGGGLFNASSGSLLIVNSTISGNSAQGSFANFYSGVVSPGGGILNFGSLAIFATTIAANSSLFDGGGLATSTLAASDPRVAPPIVTDCVIAANTNLGSNPGQISGDVFGAISPSSSNNIIGAAGSVTGVSNGVNHNRIGTTSAPIDPRLGALANNGGPTETMVPLPNSPAIETGVVVPGVSTDQRGITRPQGKAPEIGAVELEGVATPPPQVIGVRTSIVRGRPVRIIISFDQPLVAATARRIVNYSITDESRGGRRVAVAAASYNARSNSVTLTATRALSVKDRYRIRVNGTKKGAVTSLFGGVLDGNGDGMPGGDYINTFTGIS
jgi:hypothetical protein